MLVVNGNQLNIKKGETILQTLESNGIDILTGCKAGDCGFCRCNKIKGNVILTTEPLAFINNNEILACISLAPTQGVLEITC